jgi:hypothetical protein
MGAVRGEGPEDCVVGPVTVFEENDVPLSAI